MTKRELLHLLEEVPDDAEIYVEADNGQLPLKAAEKKEYERLLKKTNGLRKKAGEEKKEDRDLIWD